MKSLKKTLPKGKGSKYKSEKKTKDKQLWKQLPKIKWLGKALCMLGWGDGSRVKHLSWSVRTRLNAQKPMSKQTWQPRKRQREKAEDTPKPGMHSNTKTGSIRQAARTDTQAHSCPGPSLYVLWHKYAHSEHKCVHTNTYIIHIWIDMDMDIDT